MVARLPVPGSDNGTWGQILNTFLGVAHNSDGTLLTSALQQSGGITSVNGKTSTNGSVTVAADDVGAIPSSSIGAANGVAALNGGTRVPATQLGTGTASSSNFLRGDGVWTVPSSGSSTLAGDSDVALSGNVSTQVLSYNGTSWVNSAAPRSSLAVVYSADCPASLKSIADSTFIYQCTGSNDDVVINAAISQVAATGQSYSGNGVSGGTGSAPSGGGGTVLLMGYTYNLSSPIVMKSWVSVVGGFDRAATRLLAASAFSGSQLIELEYPWTERTNLRNFYLYGNKNAGLTAHGIYYVGQQDATPYSDDDPGHQITDLIIHAPGGDGVYMDLSTRATRVTRVRVEQAGNYGFYANGDDSFFTDCESGGSNAEGWYVSGTNNNFVNLKSWYAHTHGYTIASTRCQFANCLAQDAYQHGWNIVFGKNTMVGCMSDSAGLNTTGYGINISSALAFVTIRGHQSFDRNATPHQQYGIYFASKLVNGYSSIDVVTYNNATGSYYDNSGVNTADPTSLISIRGN